MKPLNSSQLLYLVQLWRGDATPYVNDVTDADRLDLKHRGLITLTTDGNSTAELTTEGHDRLQRALRDEARIVRPDLRIPDVIREKIKDAYRKYKQGDHNAMHAVLHESALSMGVFMDHAVFDADFKALKTEVDKELEQPK